MVPDMQTEFFLRWWTKSKVFLFSFRTEQTDATQACYRRGIVTKFSVIVEGVLRVPPPAAGRIFYLLQQKNSNFNAI